jgi:hypothetical protein
MAVAEAQQREQPPEMGEAVAVVRPSMGAITAELPGLERQAKDITEA